MSESPPLPPAPQLNGRIFVVVFLVFLVGATWLASRMRYINRERIAEVQRQIRPPLPAKIEVGCRNVDGTVTPLKDAGRCRLGGSLSIEVQAETAELRQVTFLLLGTDPLVTGQLNVDPAGGQAGAPGSGRVDVPLAGMSSGPYLLSMVLSSAPLPLSALARAAAEDSPPQDVPNRLLSLETYLKSLQSPGRPVRVERLHMRVESAGE